MQTSEIKNIQAVESKENKIIEDSTTDYDMMAYIDFIKKLKPYRHSFDDDGKLRCWYNGVTREKMNEWRLGYHHCEHRPWDDCKKGYMNLAKRRPQK